MSDKRLTADILLAAYSAGIFPMGESREANDVYWVDPVQRGILPLDRFHVSHSLIRRLRRDDYTVRANSDILGVLDGCAGREETWINDTIRSLTVDLFQRGDAHTVEVWQDGSLAGGVYGIALGGAFFGESMFSRNRDGSKIALTWLVDHLKRCGFRLFDTQFTTPHLESLGAQEISRAEYRQLLSTSVDLPVSFDSVPFETDRYAVVQRMTQTS